MVKYFTKEDEKEIVKAIQDAEKHTSGQIHVHLRKKCKKEPLAEAHQVFKKLGLHRTKEKNVVLIFVAPESRHLAIVGDEGIHVKVGAHFWDQTRDLMLEFFKKNQMKQGVVAGIRSAGEKLRQYFPVKPGNSNLIADIITED